MRKTHHLWLGAVLLAIATLVSSCATSINHVLADPGRYRNRDVTVSGYVADSFSILNRGAYRIQDRSGSIWVMSDRGVPRQGAHVKVHGTIREGFNIGPLADRLPRGVGIGLVLVDAGHRADR